MRTAWLGLAVLLAATAAPVATGQTPAPETAWTLASLGVDPESPIESRFGQPPKWLVDLYAQSNETLAGREPTEAERQKFARALDALTPLQRQVAQERLKSISVVDKLDGNASTLRESCAPPCVAFSLMISSQVFGETVSEFLSRKEQKIFDTAGSALSVRIEAGSLDALTFILTHETTHMVDMLMHVTPMGGPAVMLDETNHTPFTRGVWSGLRMFAPAYRSELLEASALRSQGKPLPVAKAGNFYEELERTPFVSSYASIAYVEDLPELVAFRVHTEKLKQPYRIEIRDGDTAIYTYEPMANPLVRSRLPALEIFDKVAG